MTTVRFFTGVSKLDNTVSQISWSFITLFFFDPFLTFTMKQYPYIGHYSCSKNILEVEKVYWNFIILMLTHLKSWAPDPADKGWSSNLKGKVWINNINNIFFCQHKRVREMEYLLFVFVLLLYKCGKNEYNKSLFNVNEFI